MQTSIALRYVRIMLSFVLPFLPWQCDKNYGVCYNGWLSIAWTAQVYVVMIGRREAMLSAICGLLIIVISWLTILLTLYAVVVRNGQSTSGLNAKFSWVLLLFSFVLSWSGLYLSEYSGFSLAIVTSISVFALILLGLFQPVSRST